MRSPFILSSLLHRALPGLLCASALVACEPGNDLKRYSGRNLRLTMRDNQGTFIAFLDRNLPESGCLQLHPDVEATFDGMPLEVYPGPPIVDRDRCNSLDTPPFFSGKLDIEQFFGEPRNAVLEVRDDEERIIAEFTHFYGRHTFERVDPPPIVKPGEEIFLKWDPPTDDLSRLEAVSLKGTEVPVRHEAGGMRFTVPANFPAGRVNVSSVGELIIPAERCEGVVRCTATPWPLAQPAQIDVQP